MVVFQEEKEIFVDARYELTLTADIVDSKHEWKSNIPVQR